MSKLDKVPAVIRFDPPRREAKSISVDKLRLVAEDGDVMLAGFNLRVSPLALAQVCLALEIPVAYMGRLPATLVVQNVNHGLKALKRECGPVSLMVDQGRMVVLEVVFSRNGGEAQS